MNSKQKTKLKKVITVCWLSFLILSIFIPIKGYHASIAETPVWERVFESPNEDVPTQILSTSDGYLLTGSRDRGEPIQTPWVIKVDLEGVEQWNQSYTPESKPQGHLRSIIQTLDGGYTLTGIASDSPLVQGTWDLWVLKINENGTEEWDKVINGIEDGADYGSQIVPVDGGFLIGGATQSTFATEGWVPEYWLLKLNDTGDLEWNKTYRREGYDQVTALVPLKDGNYLMSGLSDHPHSIWIVKIDGNGSVLWDQTYRTGTDSFIAWERNLIETSEGGFLLTCYPRANNYQVGQKFWIIKCDSNGNIEWDTTFDSLNYDTPTVCLQSHTGDYYIAGSCNSANGDTERGDMCILRLNSSGDIQGNITYGKEGHGERIVDMILTEGSDSSEALITLAFVENGGIGAEYRDFWLGKFVNVDEIIDKPTKAPTSSKSGTFPGFLPILLFFITLAFINQRKKNS